MRQQDLMKTVARGIAQKEYSLLAGAGATVGVVGGDGGLIPTAAGLKDALIERFALGEGAADAPLQRVFTAAKDSDPSRLAAFLTGRFLGTTPTWHGQLNEFNWERVWTLNIDDVLENAFRRRGRRIASLSWLSSSARRQAAKDLEVVHLHGWARDVEERLANEGADHALRALIFDWSQYGQATREERVWHQRFTDEFIDTPFVVLGARIVDEVDFWKVLGVSSQAEKQFGFPSVVVLKSVTAFDRQQLERFHVHVIESDAESFISELSAKYREVLAEETPNYDGPQGAPQRFLSQFKNLRKFEPATGTNANEFYSGWEPNWYTIQQDADAIFELTERLADMVDLEAGADDAQQRFILLHSGPGTGKSAMLLRIAERARGNGLTPWAFREDEMLDVEALVEWARTNPQSVFLFDDCADFAGAIGEALTQATAAGIRLSVVGAVRDNRFEFALARVPAESTTADFGPAAVGVLTDEDISRLLSKLRGASRLGRITRIPEADQRRYFSVEHRGQLFNAMANLEGGPGFTARVVSTFRGIEGDQLKLLVASAALSYSFGLALRVSTAAQLTGLTPGEIADACVGALSGILVTDRDGLKLPHRVTASMYLNNAVTEPARYLLAVGLANAIAPHIDRLAVVNMSREQRLARQLLSHERIGGIVGQRRVRDFYDAVEAAYGWNGRFWDQRALFEAVSGDLKRARSYAEKSILLHGHPFAYTTLGKVLFAVAMESGDARDVTDAVDALRRAREDFSYLRNWQADDHPFSLYFTGVLGFAHRYGISALDRTVRQGWDDWLREARHRPSSDVREEIPKWMQQWGDLRMGELDLS